MPTEAQLADHEARIRTIEEKLGLIPPPSRHSVMWGYSSQTDGTLITGIPTLGDSEI